MVPRADAETKLRLTSAAATVGRLTKGAATVGRLTETVETLVDSTLRFLIGALLELELLLLLLLLELLLLLLLLELLRGMIQEEKFARTFRNLDIHIVV